MITPAQDVVIAGRYTLVRPLAHGGMGSVWLAHHRDLEVDVTVKFMAPSLVADADARMRFEREAKVAARLRSQHVVQVIDYGVEADTPYIVMELLRGESLSARLTRDRRLDLSDVARLVVQTCKALRTAHDAGLVHRDLKPGNVFLALKDEDEVVKVLDFGIAKAKAGFGEAHADTESGVILGSVHYMSPEQIHSSRTVDHRSDLWSLGVIVYHMLTGRLPFPGKTQWEVLLLVGRDERPPLPAAAPHLPARIDDFFDRALARDLNRRFQSALELSEAFSAIALDRPELGKVTEPSVAARAEEITRDGTTRKVPAPESEIYPPPRFPAEALVIADPPTADSEITMGSIRAVLVSGEQAKLALQSVEPAAGKIRGRSRASLIVALLATTGLLVWILKATLRTESHSTMPELATASAPPAAAAMASQIASANTLSLEAAAPLATSAAVTAQPSVSARAPAPREKPPSVVREHSPPSVPEPRPPASAPPKPMKRNLGPLERSF